LLSIRETLLWETKNTAVGGVGADGVRVGRGGRSGKKKPEGMTQSGRRQEVPSSSL